MSKKNDPESSNYFEGDIVKNLPIVKDFRPFIEAMADLIIADMIRYPDLDEAEGETGLAKPKGETGDGNTPGQPSGGAR